MRRVLLSVLVLLLCGNFYTQDMVLRLEANIGGLQQHGSLSTTIYKKTLGVFKHKTNNIKYT